MYRIKPTAKILFLIFLFLIPSSFASSNGNDAFEQLKICKIAFHVPVASKKSETLEFINEYFQKYVKARPQATYIPVTTEKQSINLQELKKQGYDLAVVSQVEKRLLEDKHTIEVYELYQNRKLWIFSEELEWDLELLFWILDRSLIAGIKIVPNTICLGLVPGKDGDLGRDFPCSTVYHTIDQLPNIEVKAIPLEMFNQAEQQANSLFSKFGLDYIIFYQSEELDYTKPLIKSSILKTNGEIYGDLTMRIETNQIGSFVKNPNRPQPSYPNPLQPTNTKKEPIQPRSDPLEASNLYVETDYLECASGELGNYLLAALLTEFFHPQKKPLKLKLNHPRKYINKNSFPLLDSTELPKYTIRYKLK